MMFSQPYHSSTEEESSDEGPTSTVSDTPSKATGTDSWYDVKSDTTTTATTTTKTVG